MSDPAVQIIARGQRAEAEAAAAAIDRDALLEGATYSILEEDEDRGVWRIDAFPTEAAEADRFRDVLAGFVRLAVEQGLDRRAIAEGVVNFYFAAHDVLASSTTWRCTCSPRTPR